MKIRATDTSNRQEIWSYNDHIGDLVLNPLDQTWELDCTEVQDMLSYDTLVEIASIIKQKNSIIRGNVHA